MPNKKARVEIKARRQKAGQPEAVPLAGPREKLLAPSQPGVRPPEEPSLARPRIVQVELKKPLRRIGVRASSRSPFRFTNTAGRQSPRLHVVLNRHALHEARDGHAAKAATQLYSANLEPNSSRTMKKRPYPIETDESIISLGARFCPPLPVTINRYCYRTVNSP